MEFTSPYQDRQSVARTNFVKRISWSAVLAGVLVAIVTQLLLSLLGLGVGLGSIDALEEQNPTAGLGIGTAVWYMLSSLLALFLGGWVAGRLASAPRMLDGILHGVLTWCIVTLLTIYFLTTSIGRLLGGASRLVGGVVRTAGSAVSSAAPGLGNALQEQLQQNGIDINDLDLTDLRREVNTLLRQTGDPSLKPEVLENKVEGAKEQSERAANRAGSNPQAADDIATNLVNRLFRQGKETISQVDREDAVNVVMKRTGKSRVDAEQTVDNWIKAYQQARVKFEQTKQQAELKARQVADDAAGAASKAAIYGFFGLLIGVAAAGYGAKTGTDSKEPLNPVDRPVGASR
ncbi:hypothetical protein GCM10027347_54890 [Larkinella harenae]